MNADLVRKSRLLKDDANPAFQLVCGAGRIDAQDRNIAAIARPKSFEDLNGRALAGAVRTEHREDLAGLNVEIDALNGAHIAIALGELLNMDDRCHDAREYDGGKCGEMTFRRKAVFCRWTRENAG